MNSKDAQHEQLEELLRKAHLPEPLPQLRERITAAARRAWDQALQELPWLIPFRRLVASAAAAVLIIWLADCASDLTLAKWSSGTVQAVSQQPAGIEVLPEMPYSPFVRRLASLDRRSSVIDASALKDRIEALRHVLDEAQREGPTKPPVPTEGRSRLVPNPSGDNSYS